MAGGKNRANVRIFGDDDDAVYVGEKGVVLPTEPGDRGLDLMHTGWLGEDGINIDQETTINRFNGHQGGAFLRQKKGGTNRSFSFQCLEDTATNFGLYYPGAVGTTNTTSGITHFAVPAAARSDERSWQVETWDDDIWKLYNIPVGEVGETGTISHTNSGIAVYEFTVGVLGDFDVYSNNPAWAVANTTV